ncbi:MAG: thiopurine S-methyltransferase [Candidatus Thiodiazotropha sp. (ex Ctena orbiculata)]|nr:thiopurine S-methyltransferase [Candidatus Thiodiazotropha taylori]MBT2998548.1 thiopurine S-methyltransferase [Candidatus Thiodiazotropha taylori]MBT3002722.1 thiopurine S-methyltransferase [Candidatus Thiodiazotropha taylori]MBT3028864.1 thiopurine S-methyltransferase [Candidatus Thiodiazotropha taylori]MBT3036566.1 thiopurine S-methyltransferase [Candidatus Thiodiazotropha taylori]
MASAEESIKAPNDNWLQRWKDNNIGWHHTEFNQHLLNYWHALFLPQGSLVFAPLCGKSRDMAWLAEQGYRIRGIELSPLAVEAFFDELNLQPEVESVGDFQYWHTGPYEIYCGDIFDIEQLDNSDIAAVYDRASLIALNPQQRIQYAQMLQRILPDRTKVLLITLEYPQNEMEGPPYSVSGDEVESLFAKRYSIQHLHSLNILRDTGRYCDKDVSRMQEHIYLLK